tara:strand:- start:454 stop:693 length:240 start_codon:yes stop_codon:yes gene_type:complete
MQAPRLPSLFKSINVKKFYFKPRYYDERKERRKQLLKEEKNPLKFKRTNLKTSVQKGRKYRILFLIIILSLLAYKLLIN